MKYPVLIRVKDKKAVEIKSYPFYVGYSSFCDMTINNKALNDVHFNIDVSGDKFIVNDEITRNYTSVDDDYAVGYRAIELKNYSVIRAANELFVFIEGEKDFGVSIKGAFRKDLMRRVRAKGNAERRVDFLPDNVRVISANEYYSMYMNDECVDDVVFFAYERNRIGTTKYKMVICTATEEQKGTIKWLRSIGGTTGKISNAKVVRLKMADAYEFEYVDDDGKVLGKEELCWNGKVNFRGFDIPSSNKSFSVNLKVFGKIVDTIKVEF